MGKCVGVWGEVRGYVGVFEMWGEVRESVLGCGASLLGCRGGEVWGYGKCGGGVEKCGEKCGKVCWGVGGGEKRYGERCV